MKTLIIIFKLLISFLVSLSVIVFLVSLLSMVQENTKDSLTLALATSGCAFLIVIFVYIQFHNDLNSLFEKYKESKKENQTEEKEY